MSVSEIGRMRRSSFTPSFDKVKTLRSKSTRRAIAAEFSILRDRPENCDIFETAEKLKREAALVYLREKKVDGVGTKRAYQRGDSTIGVLIFRVIPRSLDHGIGKRREMPMRTMHFRPTRSARWLNESAREQRERIAPG